LSLPLANTALQV